MYIQQKDLNAAFVQSKAMDKRFDEGGRTIDGPGLHRPGQQGSRHRLQVLRIRRLSLGRNDANYLQARIGAVRTRYDQLTEQPEPARTDLLDLDQRMPRPPLTELGVNKATIELMRERRTSRRYLPERPGCRDAAASRPSTCP